MPGEGITPGPLATGSLISVANIPDRDYEKGRLAGEKGTLVGMQTTGGSERLTSASPWPSDQEGLLRPGG